MTSDLPDEESTARAQERGRGPACDGHRSSAGLLPVAVVVVLMAAGLVAAVVAVVPVLLSGHRDASLANPAVAPRAGGLRGDAVWAAGARPAPGFTLTDQAGRSVSLNDERDHVALVTFLSSRCRAMCPLEARQLAMAIGLLPRRDRPVLLVVSVDRRDTPRSIESFMNRTGLATRLPWHWLGGATHALRRVWTAYGIDVEPSNGDVGHSVVTYVIDRNGNERSGYLTPLRVRDLAHDIGVLAASRDA